MTEISCSRKTHPPGRALAAWRELAPVAHELKNRFSPAGHRRNLMRAKHKAPHIFEEFFTKAPPPCWPEIDNLKSIIRPFQRILHMPQPQPQHQVNTSAILLRVFQRTSPAEPLDFMDSPICPARSPDSADPALLHRAAPQSPPQRHRRHASGGEFTIRTRL